MKIAIFADLHLSAQENTPQEAALDWAIQTLQVLRPDAAAVLGDITCCGSVPATLRYLQKAAVLDCPVLTVPGNSDLRCPQTGGTVERLLTSGSRHLAVQGVQIVGLNVSHGTLPEEERARLTGLSEQESILLVSHQGPAHIDADSRSFLQYWIQARTAAGQKLLGWIFGHIHLALTDTFAGAPLVSLCALDPDKNSGDYPGLILAEVDSAGFTIQPYRFTEGLPCQWTAAQRREFTDYLGVSCYDPVRDMPLVLQSGVRNIEWRCVPPEALPFLARWRSEGGRSFSIHLPGISPDSAESIAAFATAAEQAAAVRPQLVTVHPPQIAGERLFPGQPLFDRFADTVAAALQPLREVGVKIVIENNHTPSGSSRDVSQIDFGCTPGDIVLWRDALARRLGKACVGLRLDIGHARNNVPLSEEYPLGVWYTLLGTQFDTYHLHQTRILPDGRMQNHHAIIGWHSGLISFDGFLNSWHTGRLRHGPMILEIQHGDRFAVWNKLTELIRSGRAE